MRATLRWMVTILAWVAVGSGAAFAAGAERRLGLVVGNGEYAAGALPTAANDAGLMAQTLQAAGFDVMGARDLDGDSLRRTFRDFSDKVTEAGPDTVVVVYLAGHGLQYEGDNYFTGVDAKIDRDVDVPTNGLRLSDFIRPIQSARPKSLVVVMDMARDTPFAKTGNPLAGGLALMEPVAGTLYAANAAPGTLAPAETENYGTYARALAEMIREGDLPLHTLFDRVRLRVNEATQGGAVPWNAGRVDVAFRFFERAPDAPKRAASYVLNEARLEKPIRQFSEAEEAYFAALERDSLGGYLEFLDAYPDARQAKRVRAIVAARREALTWRRTRLADTPNAYWTFLDRYPDGPHSWDARRRLAYLTAPIDPPLSFTSFIYDDLPPPPVEELYYVRRRPAFYFYDPVFAFVAPPLCPIFFLPPPPPRFFFPPPPRPVFAYMLPVPAYVPVAAYVRPVANLAPVANNPFVGHLHEPIAASTGEPVGPAHVGSAGPVTPSGRSIGGTAAAIGAGVVVGAVIGAAAARVALPPSVSRKAALQPSAQPPLTQGLPRPTGAAGAVGAGIAAGAGASQSLVKPLPGAHGGTPLPLPKPAQGASASVGATPKAAGLNGSPSILMPQKVSPTILPPGRPSPGTGAASSKSVGAQPDPGAEALRKQEADRAAQQARSQAQQREQSARLQQQSQAAAAAQARAQQQAQASAALARSAQQRDQAARSQQQAQQRQQLAAQAQARAQVQQQSQQRAAAQQKPPAKPTCGAPGLPVCRN